MRLCLQSPVWDCSSWLTLRSPSVPASRPTSQPLGWLLLAVRQDSLHVTFAKSNLLYIVEAHIPPIKQPVYLNGTLSCHPDS